MLFTCTTTIITLEPCALNAEFQHFIPRFNQISLLKEGIGGERRPKEAVSLRKTLWYRPIFNNWPSNVQSPMGSRKRFQWHNSPWSNFTDTPSGAMFLGSKMSTNY